MNNPKKEMLRRWHLNHTIIKNCYINREKFHNVDESFNDNNDDDSSDKSDDSNDNSIDEEFDAFEEIEEFKKFHGDAVGLDDVVDDYYFSYHH